MTIYGQFRDPLHTYVVTSSSMPDTIRVFAGDPHSAEMVCTISNLSARPYPSWNAKWYSNWPEWKRRFTDHAVSIWRTHNDHRPSPTRREFRTCDG
ncbi:hypothetical protein [Stackebrandtia nassauensis]|uniref:Uncharacterized protein n=1 Tax=Stackebrandtia nassauensis (strain DSM 44728 / CIP 108903 / NRRL B-16338 / NBRC 102104 / LLR-40K-21) TaxID=446470 RepID=D3Q3P5_STANL|nr:hypothetical protein [Stackebrandtia nassauensis]ADD43962.1 hypothetical protein Snas_4315 [Stackebrandtia nassauensis DSM 44728]